MSGAQVLKKQNMLKNIKAIFILLFSFQTCWSYAQGREYRLVWSDEFNDSESLDTTKWNYEWGYVRNHEQQYYQSDNARVHDGMLTITVRRDSSSQGVRYTSASINTRGKYEFLYGRLEVRARIPHAKGVWPAIWTLGSTWEWPSCGEIDVMEYYHKQGIPYILANYAHGTDQRWKAAWNSKAIPYAHFLERDPYFTDRFHIWRLDWTPDSITIWLDGEKLNQTGIAETVNGKLGEHKSPFTTPQYILLNLALGGDNGGPIDNDALPACYDIDWVRVYQPVEETSR